MKTTGQGRRGWVAVCWVALAALAVASALACLGRVHWIVNLFSHFRPQYAVLALLLAPAALLLPRRRWWFLLGAIAVAAFNLSFLLPCLLPSRTRTPPPDTPSISVLLWNTWRKNDDFERVNRVVRSTNADVVVLQETTAPVREHLADLDDAYRVFLAGPDAALTRRSLAAPVYRVDVDGLHALHLELSVGGRAVDLIATHLLVPISGAYAATRVRQLAALTAWVKGRAAPVVVLGDLNATPWSYEMEDLCEACRLEDSLVGRGLQPSWPFDRVLTSLLRIPIDHCLHTREVVAFDRAVGEPEGSNHRSLFVRIALAN